MTCTICATRPADMPRIGVCRICYLQRWRARQGPCKGPQCERQAVAHGYCSGHYKQHKKGMPLTPLQSPAPRQKEDAAALDRPKIEVMQYELQIELRAYECAVGYQARVYHRREIERLSETIIGHFQTVGA